MANKKIREYIQDLELVNQTQAKIAKKLLACFRKQGASLDEDIKYGGMVFLKEGELIGGIFSYKEYTSVEFSLGAEFKDLRGLLEGTGKLRRHLKIHELKNFKALGAESFIQQSVK